MFSFQWRNVMFAPIPLGNMKNSTSCHLKGPDYLNLAKFVGVRLFGARLLFE
jgi:hypothetical protein